jgi:hypothetical protein
MPRIHTILTSIPHITFLSFKIPLTTLLMTHIQMILGSIMPTSRISFIIGTCIQFTSLNRDMPIGMTIAMIEDFTFDSGEKVGTAFLRCG